MLILNRNSIASLSIIIFFLKTKIKSYGNEVTDFYYKKFSKVDSNHTYIIDDLERFSDEE